MAAPSNSFKPFAVVIKNHYHPTYSLRIMIQTADITIGKLKTQIEEQHKGNPQIQDQLLVYRGKLLDSKTNMAQLLQSSIIKTKSQSPTNTTEHSTDTNIIQSMYIHMTLRGGSETATRIGLTASESNQKDDKDKNDRTMPVPIKSNVNSEEEKYAHSNQSKPNMVSPSNGPIPRQFSPYQHPPPRHGHGPPPPYPMHHYPPIPPPNPYYYSQSMPDLYHLPPQYLHRQQSAPQSNGNNNAYPSQPYALPTLVQQTSNPNMHMPPSYPYPYPPPYGYMPMPMHMPMHMPPPQPFGHRSHSTSDLSYMRGKKTIQNVKPIVPNKIDEKNENEHENEHKQENNNQTYGLRQRRVANVANNNVDNDNNNNNNVAAAAANVVNNNVNNVANVAGEGWISWFFRILNINILIRLGIFMWLFGPNLGTYRFTILCVAGGFYYLHQVGILQRIFGRFRRGNRNRNEPRHRDPNANNNDDNNNNNNNGSGDNNNNNNNRVPLLPLGYVQLLQRFLIGIFASLWPTWDHRNVYPVNQD